MILKAIDRLMLMKILPQQGDLLQTKIVSDMKAKLDFSEAEQQELDMKRTPEGNLQWTSEKDTGKEFSFGPRGLVIVKDTLKDLDKNKKLLAPHIPLWEAFIGPIEVEADEKVTVGEALTQ